MNLKIMPLTRLGKWSMWLILAFAVFFILSQILVALGERGGDTIFSNLKLTIPVLIAGICGVSAFFTGIIGIIKSKERSIVAFISTTTGLLVLIFIVGEIIGGLVVQE